MGALYGMETPPRGVGAQRFSVFDQYVAAILRRDPSAGTRPQDDIIHRPDAETVEAEIPPSAFTTSLLTGSHN